MPIAQSNGCPIHYEMEGAQDKPVLMFCNSLGTNLHMWDTQMPAVLNHFRVLRYDRRGHGTPLGAPEQPRPAGYCRSGAWAAWFSHRS